LADGKPSAPDARPTLRLKPGARTIAVKEGVCTITLPPYGTAVLAPPRERVAAQAN